MPGPWSAHDRALRRDYAMSFAESHWNGHQPPAWQAPKWFTLWVPVILSFVAQVPAAFFIARFTGAGMQQTVVAVVLALGGPLALIAARRFPGPVVAVVAVLASVDLFVHPTLQDHGGPPYLALAFAIV